MVRTPPRGVFTANRYIKFSARFHKYRSNDGGIGNAGDEKCLAKW